MNFIRNPYSKISLGESKLGVQWMFLLWLTLLVQKTAQTHSLIGAPLASWLRSGFPILLVMSLIPGTWKTLSRPGLISCVFHDRQMYDVVQWNLSNIWCGTITSKFQLHKPTILNQEWPRASCSSTLSSGLKASRSWIRSQASWVTEAKYSTGKVRSPERMCLHVASGDVPRKGERPLWNGGAWTLLKQHLSSNILFS